MRSIEQAMACNQAEPIPFFGITELQELAEDERMVATQTAERVYRERPESAAVHLCLTSATALLDVAQTLLNRTTTLSPEEREQEWNALVDYTKRAGRAAYRAALVLTDTKTAA